MASKGRMWLLTQCAGGSSRAGASCAGDFAWLHACVNLARHPVNTRRSRRPQSQPYATRVAGSAHPWGVVAISSCSHGRGARTRSHVFAADCSRMLDGAGAPLRGAAESPNPERVADAGAAGLDFAQSELRAGILGNHDSCWIPHKARSRSSTQPRRARSLRHHVVSLFRLHRLGFDRTVAAPQSSSLFVLETSSASFANCVLSLSLHKHSHTRTPTHTLVHRAL